jgi:hypothetical protein
MSTQMLSQYHVATPSYLRDGLRFKRAPMMSGVGCIVFSSHANPDDEATEHDLAAGAVLDALPVPLSWASERPHISSIALGSMQWMPLLPSTVWVTRRSAMMLHRL